MKFTLQIAGLTLLLLATLNSLNAQTNHLDLFKNLTVRSVGPANMSGRITTIDVVRSDPNTMYVGAASGGVWKSENGGTRWEPIFDDNPTQNIGALAIQQDQPNVIWVGTGEGNPRNSMNLGMGLFRSTDGGDNWEHMGLEATKTIHRIIVHPEDGNTVFVGAMGDTFNPGPDRGLYKTTDGGKTWKKVLYTNEKSGVADLVMDPTNPNKMLCALYEHHRTPFSFVSGGEGSGLYLTEDGGETWQKLTEAEGLPKGDLGRIGLAIAPSNPDRMYAKVEAKRNALYRSDDGGNSWEMINDNPRFTNNRPFYFQELAVSSDDPDLLYNIYQPLSVSYDGGISFDPVPQIPADETKGIHADFHAFWMSPDDAEFYIIGGDGGIGITRDSGESWFFAESIPVAQLYHVNVDEELPYNVYAGMQDNGNWYGPGYVWRRGGIRTLYWQYLVGGDGFYISPDAEDARFGYGTSQNGALYRYDKVGGYYSSIKPHNPGGPRLRFHWNAAFAQDPHDTKTVYYGSQFVHLSRDKGKTWTIISPDLTTDNEAQQKRDYGGLTADASGAEFYNCILALAPSPVNKELIWAGTDDGNIQITRDGGGTWNEVGQNIKEMPAGAWVARIHASAYQEGTAWAVVNNYRKGDYKPYLFKTEDYGATWQSMVKAESPVFGYSLSFIQDPVEPNLVFLGTENGLWVSFDQGENWEQFKNGYPSVSTMDLKIQRRESALIIGTFGRAIWVIDDLQAMRVVASQSMTDNLTAGTVAPAVQVKGIFINAPGNIWSGFHTTFQGDNRPFWQVNVPYFIKEPKEGTMATATVVDANNKTVMELAPKDTAVKGLNYMTWKLDETINRLPNSWINEESRGIPVLPGTYQMIITYAGDTEQVAIEVIADPRFDFDADIDKVLYQAQKEIDNARKQLNADLDELATKKESLGALIIQLENTEETGLLKSAQDLYRQIRMVEYMALSKPVDRQVGAWQSFEETATSVIRKAERKFMSSHTMPSNQELELLRDVKTVVWMFNAVCEDKVNSEWNYIKRQVAEKGIDWK